MKTSRIFGLLLFLLLAQKVSAQKQPIQGKAFDALTGLPVPFVSVAVVGGNTVTSTNENGEFILVSAEPVKKIRFSHISYQILDTLAVPASFMNISLAPLSISLKEVIVSPVNGVKILNAALAKARDHLKEIYTGKAFYRQLTTIDNEPSEIHEIFYDIKWNAANIFGWVARQSRFAKSADQSFAISNQSYLSFSLTGVLYNFRNVKHPAPDNLKDYDVAFEKYISNPDQDIAVISCTRKTRKVRKRMAYMDVTYYIGTKDHNIYKIESRIHNLRFRNSSNLGNYYITASFADHGLGIPVIENLNTKLDLPYRSGNEKHLAVVNSMITVYESNPDLINENFNTSNENTDDMNTIRDTGYDAYFWMSNPIVKRTAPETEFIRSMESKNAFGTMIK